MGDVLVRLVRGFAILAGLGLAISIVAALLGAGGLGDGSVRVTFFNASAQRVTVYPYGQSYEAGKRILDPGERASENLLASGGDRAHLARVEAFDDNGVLVFCHSYTIGEVRSLEGVVTVNSGQNDCR